MQVHTLKDFSTRMCSCFWSAKLTEVAFHITCKQQSGTLIKSTPIFTYIKLLTITILICRKKFLFTKLLVCMSSLDTATYYCSCSQFQDTTPHTLPTRAPQRKISKETQSYSRWNKCSLKVHVNSTFYKPLNLWKTTSASVCLSRCILTSWEISNTSASLHLLLSTDALS